MRGKWLYLTAKEAADYEVTSCLHFTSPGCSATHYISCFLCFRYQTVRTAEQWKEFHVIAPCLSFYVRSLSKRWSGTIFYIPQNQQRCLRNTNVDLISHFLPLLLSPPTPAPCFHSFPNGPHLSQRSSGWRTTWTSRATPSSWCRTTRGCWLWTSARRAVSTAADTPAGPSMTWEWMRWSASWRFEVRTFLQNI